MYIICIRVMYNHIKLIMIMLIITITTMVILIIVLPGSCRHSRTWSGRTAYNTSLYHIILCYIVL